MNRTDTDRWISDFTRAAGAECTARECLLAVLDARDLLDAIDRVKAIRERTSAEFLALAKVPQ